MEEQWFPKPQVVSSNLTEDAKFNLVIRRMSMERKIDKVLAHQTIIAMGEIVDILKILESENMDLNPNNCALFMEGPVDMMKDLVKDLERSLDIEDWNDRDD